jgi:hypothetical protein
MATDLDDWFVREILVHERALAPPVGEVLEELLGDGGRRVHDVAELLPILFIREAFLTEPQGGPLRGLVIPLVRGSQVAQERRH